MAEVIYADDAMKHRIPRRRGGPVGMEVDPEAVEAMMDHYDRAIARITTMAGLVGCPRCGTHVPLLHAGDGTDRYTAHGPVEDGNDCPLSGALIP